MKFLAALRPTEAAMIAIAVLLVVCVVNQAFL